MLKGIKVAKSSRMVRGCRSVAEQLVAESTAVLGSKNWKIKSQTLALGLDSPLKARNGSCDWNTRNRHSDCSIGRSRMARKGRRKKLRYVILLFRHNFLIRFILGTINRIRSRRRSISRERRSPASLPTSFPGSLFSASLSRWTRDPGCGWSRDHPESRW